jgi:hypothetical protein
MTAARLAQPNVHRGRSSTTARERSGGFRDWHCGGAGGDARRRSREPGRRADDASYHVRTCSTPSGQQCLPARPWWPDAWLVGALTPGRRAELHASPRVRVRDAEPGRVLGWVAAGSPWCHRRAPVAGSWPSPSTLVRPSSGRDGEDHHGRARRPGRLGRAAVVVFDHPGDRCRHRQHPDCARPRAGGRSARRRGERTDRSAADRVVSQAWDATAGRSSVHCRGWAASGGCRYAGTGMPGGCRSSTIGRVVASAPLRNGASSLSVCSI